MKSLLLAAVVALTASSAVEAQTGEPVGSITIDDSFYIDTLEARGGLPDIEIALAFTQQNGRVVICAATASRLSGTLQQVKRAIEISESGRRIMRGIQWAPNHPAGSNLIGLQADCQITSHPAPAQPDFGLSLSRTTF